MVENVCGMDIMSIWFYHLGIQCSRCFDGLDVFGISRMFGSVFIVFIDDVVIYSRSEVDHVHYLRIVLEMFRREHLYVKFSSAYCDCLLRDFWDALSLVERY